MGCMDRLTSIDAEFLYLEDGISHMHIAGACVFGDPKPTLEEIELLVASKLPTIPRYRQRVHPVPFGLGRPVWVDDPHFDIKYHLRRAGLPAPADDKTFAELVAQLMSQPLERDRPLWEITLVEGLRDDRWALVFKVHHAMVDGVSGVGLLSAILDLEVDAALPVEEPWTPQPSPSSPWFVLDAWWGLTQDAARSVSGLPHAIANPVEAAQGLLEVGRGMWNFIPGLSSTPTTSIDGKIGPSRSWATSSTDLGDVKAIGKLHGGTVNDVVLAAVAAGHRELLLSRGEDPAELVIRTLVPVSTRRGDELDVPDNRVTAILYDLPVDEPDPVTRLSRVHEEMDVLKAAHMAEAGDVVLHLLDLAPPMILGTVSKLAERVMQDNPQHSVNTVTTNVPGPQFPLYCLGREMLEYQPFGPIAHGIRICTAILSYNGKLAFGVTGDRATMPDVGVLAEAIPAAIEELLQAQPS